MPKKTVCITIDDALHDGARELCAERGVSFSALVRELLTAAISGPGGEDSILRAEQEISGVLRRLIAEHGRLDPYARTTHEDMVRDDARLAAQRAHLAELGDASLDEILARPYVHKEPKPWF